jgi:hypothetical protein
MLENNKIEKVEKKEIKTGVYASKKVSGFSIFVYKHLKLIIFLELLVILLGGYLFIIKKEISEIENYNKLISWRKEELVKIKDYKADSLELEEKYSILEKEVAEDINELYSILPPKDDLPNVMAQIEALVNSHNFVLGSINMSSEEDSSLNKRELPLINSEAESQSNLIKEVEISIFVFSDEGGYSRVKELLEAFEHHIRFTDIVSFSFEKDMKAYSIMLKTYYLNYEE